MLLTEDDAKQKACCKCMPHKEDGKRKSKNFARIYSSCKGERLSDGKPNRQCAKCGLVSKKAKCPGCGCTVFKML